ncbi:host specificity protein [Rhizobium grahamii]|uniref:host specificity protein n=1 Tax=Rhizobium grahamii TaxID=1120045 RepID=UPI001FD186B6|nr:host specificity protein [Rhizobium grahamii]
MYAQISGSLARTSTSHADGACQSVNGDKFEEILSGMSTRSAQGSHASSSSGAIRPYSLVSQPPIVELERSLFSRKLKHFYGNEIKHISDNHEEYSHVSSKTQRTATVARLCAGIDHDTAKAPYFSYELGKISVGLLRADGGFRIKNELWRAQFPGRKNITSIVDLRVTHPLVENAGDVLLEHQLRLSDERPLIMSRPALPEMEPRLDQMGFGDVGGNVWLLDPTQHPDKWTKNSDGEWRRVGKPELYL